MQIIIDLSLIVRWERASGLVVEGKGMQFHLVKKICYHSKYDRSG